jgi:indolepyruvate ferredoxin oxidoreductase beta subunit
MKRDIILAGVGGQGILTMATVIGTAALRRGWRLKQAEVHGMSQRGGDVQSHLRLSDTPIHSDLIPEGRCDLILALEPMEALRYLSFLSPDGWIVSNRTPFVNVPDYPPFEEVWSAIERHPRGVLVDAEGVARGAANARAANVVMVGVASPHLGLDPAELEDAIRTIFARKGAGVVEANLRALRAGAEIGMVRAE